MSGKSSEVLEVCSGAPPAIPLGTDDTALGQGSTILGARTARSKDTGGAQPVSDQDTDDADDWLDRPRSKASTKGPMEFMPIVFLARKKVPCCFLCKAAANSTTPLCQSATASGQEDSDVYQGYRPWNSYRKVKDPADGEMKRTPKGCLCLICRNVFSAIGYEMEFSGFKSYKKVMTTPLGQEKHSNFLRSLSMWIAKHNRGEKTIRDKTELMQVHRKVQVEKAAKAGFKGRKKVFIEEKNWDPKKDGPWDDSKLVEETIFGKTRRGAYKFVGREGVWEAEEEENVTIKDTATEAVGNDELTAQAAEAAAETLHQKFLATHADRASQAVEAPALELADVLALAGYILYFMLY